MSIGLWHRTSHPSADRPASGCFYKSGYRQRCKQEAASVKGLQRGPISEMPIMPALQILLDWLRFVVLNRGCPNSQITYGPCLSAALPGELVTRRRPSRQRGCRKAGPNRVAGAHVRAGQDGHCRKAARNALARGQGSGRAMERADTGAMSSCELSAELARQRSLAGQSTMVAVRSRGSAKPYVVKREDPEADAGCDVLRDAGRQATNAGRAGASAERRR